MLAPASNREKPDNVHIPIGLVQNDNFVPSLRQSDLLLGEGLYFITHDIDSSVSE